MKIEQLRELEGRAGRYARAAEDIRTVIDTLPAAEETRQIIEQIRRVERPKYRQVLEWRYIKRKKWREIADLLCSDERAVLRLHGRALKEFEKLRE